MPTPRKRFSLILALILLSGFLTTSWLSYQVARDSIEEQIAEDTLPLTSDNIYSEIQRDLFRPILISSLMAHDTFVREWKLSGEKEPERLVRYLKEIQLKYNTVTSFFISEGSRKYYHSSGVLKSISESNPQDEWYFLTKNLPAGEDYVINIDTEASSAYAGSTVIFINYKVYDFHGKFIGVTGVGLAVEAVKQLVEAYQSRYKRVVYFIDINGETTLHGSAFKEPLSIHQRPGINELADHILANENSALSYQVNGETVYLNSRFVPEFNWYLMVEQRNSQSEARIKDALITNLWMSLVVTAVVLTIVYLTFNGYQKRLVYMATTDKLSGALNRQEFETLFERAIKQAKRKRTTLSLVLLDIDLFKQINDTYGHVTGDKVIRKIAQICQDYSNQEDAVCRWGGEEFLIMLPGSDKDTAIKYSAQIQQRLETIKDIPKVTVSFGIAEYNHIEAEESLLKRADSALYEAKKKGRDRIVAAA